MGIIGSIRKHSWVAVAIVGIAIIAFIVGDLTKNRNGLPDVGVINGNTITNQYFTTQTEEFEANYKRQQGVDQVPSDVDYQIREQVWQNIVEDNLMGAEYDALGMVVSNSEVSDMFGGTFIHPYLRQMFTNPQTGLYDYNQVKYITDNFDQLDTNMRLQWIETEKLVKKDRLQQKYQSLIAQSFYMPVAIAKQVAAIGSKSSQVDVVSLPYANLKDEEAAVTEKDYQNYYDKHKAEFRVREEIRNLDMVVFNVVPTQQDLADIQADVDRVWGEFQTIDAEELPYLVSSESDHSYDSTYRKSSEFNPTIDTLVSKVGEGDFIAPRIVDNQWMMAKVVKTAVRPDSLRASAIYILNQKAGGNILRSDEEAKNLADSIVALLRSGKMTFEAAVNAYSDDPNKSQNGGDMDWQLDGGYGFLNEEIVNNPIGGVFVHKHPQEVGYFIVKVTDKTPATKKYRLALITKQIVPSESTVRAAFNEAHNFAANNRTVSEMKAAAAAGSMQVRQTQATAMMQNVNGIPNSRSIIQWAFNENSEIGTVADQVFESENMFVVVALSDILEKGYAKLNQVRDMIDNQVRIEKKAEVLMARAGEAVKNAKSISDVATKLNVAVDTVADVTFSSYYFGKFGMEPKMLGAVAAAKTGELMNPVQGAQGVYVGSVVSMVNMEDANVDAIRIGMEQGYMQKVRSLSVVLRDQAKIVDQRNKFY
ncbi:MAG: SurA N-terminal domain-containing protein [Bacteroidales bacterium]|nr:SurA N-terminal domain-containing protein [Candidatus Colimorpha onthohippi]